MDEITFQNQLRELKQRVSKMAELSSSLMDSPQPHTRPDLAPRVAPNYHQDLYTAQLCDVKHKLDHMQTNLPTSTHWQGHPAPTTAPLNPVAEMLRHQAEMLKHQAFIQDDMQMLTGTIESNNIHANGNFASVRNSLTHFTREMRDRFDALENTVSALASNNNFTPACSEATLEDLAASQEGFPVGKTATEYGNGSFGTVAHAKDRDQLCYNSQPPHADDAWARDEAYIRIANGLGHRGDVPEHNFFNSKSDQAGPFDEERGTASLQGKYDGLHPAVEPEPFMAVCPPNIDHNANSNTVTDLSEQLPMQRTHEHDETTEDGRKHGDVSHGNSQPAQLQNQQSGMRFNAQVPNPSWGQVYSDQQLRIEQSTNQQLRDTIVAVDDDVVTLDIRKFADGRDMSEKDTTIAHLKKCKASAEEAFEPTRSDLEKRLGDAEYRQLEYETECRRWKECAQHAQRDLEATTKRYHELREAKYDELVRLRNELKECEASRHNFMTKYVDENYRLKWLQQVMIQGEQRLHQQLDGCERALEDAERDRDDAIRGALESRDKELDKLHVFCEEKDVVVRRQEQIIAQGASILEERDAEIDRLSAALDVSKRNEQDAREHAAKNKRTIEKRDAQLENLHRNFKEERDRRCRLEDLMRRDADAMRTGAKVDIGAEREKAHLQAMSRAQSGGPKPSWTPQPIRPSDRLPQEENRASLWENGEHATTKHRFGSSSPIVQRKQQSGRDSNKERAYDDQRPLASSNDVKEDGSRSQRHPHSAMHTDPSRHQPEPQENNRKALQLLAGWTESLQGQQKDNRPHEQWASGSRRHTRQTHADMRPATDGGNGGGRSPSSRMKAQAGPTNRGPAENGRYALPLDTRTWLPAQVAPAVVERVGSVSDLRAGSRRSESREHASKEHSAMSKPASMFDLRPQTRHMPSPQQTYRAPSVETEAESSSADERERAQQ